MCSKTIREETARAQKVLIGLGEEWKLSDGQERESLLQAYGALYDLIKDKDYFIVTMAVDALIYDTSLGSRTETAASMEKEPEAVSCPAAEADEKTLELMEKYFPIREKKRAADTRWKRIVAPCGNETWRQCSKGCTKDIWEPGEIPEEICPHCGAPLTGNTIEAQPYIEEGYLPQWDRYTRWLADTWNTELLVLELGVGFANPTVIRFPFEKLVYYNQKARMYRVHRRFSQVTEEIKDRAAGVPEHSVSWVCRLGAESITSACQDGLQQV